MIDLTHTKVEEFIMTVQTPYRYDVVGSFLRPEKLKQARKDYESKKISREELTQIEDECITDLVQKKRQPAYTSSQMVNSDVLHGT